jgi:UDP-2,3-diacylglucosamine pyrophosphatase LpxH
MQVSFDLISDLHVDTWDSNHDWRSLPTSGMCVVAGDIGKDRTKVIDTIKNLSESYQAVVYIDGNDEHKLFYSDFENSYSTLENELLQFENVYYLKDKVTVIDGVAFLGVNGWWTYDFDNKDHYDFTKRWLVERTKISMDIANNIESLALNDVSYLTTSVQRLQTHNDVSEIVIVSHTVPLPELVEHDLEIEGSNLLNSLGNSYLKNVFDLDTEAKISTWCFGHYHGGNIDQMIGGVRFVNNPRGRGGTKWCKDVYYPKKIKL